MLLLLLACDEYVLDVGPDTTGVDSAVTDTGDAWIPTQADGPCAALVIGEAEEIDGRCAIVGEADPDAMDIVVRFTSEGGITGANSVPLVGHLVDDDGDGEVGPTERPEIVIFEMDGRVRVLDADGLTLASLPLGASEGTLTLVDVDGDGFSEIIVPTMLGAAQAMRVDGTIVWEADVPTDPTGMNWFATVCELDGDADAEILVDSTVVDASDGAILWDFDRKVTSGTSVCSDLDGDGVDEILYGPQVVGADGETRFSVEDFDDLGSWVWANPLAVQADDDDAGEVLVVFAGGVALLDDDGTERARDHYAGDVPGVPCAGDLDGDGDMEIAVPGQGTMQAYDGDGTLLWRVDVDHQYAPGGCVVWDVDQDGAHEVIAHNDTGVRIFNGVDGMVRFEDRESGGTIHQGSPVVADLDRSGGAELIVANGSPTPFEGVTVYGQVDDAWPAADSVWPRSCSSGEVALDGTAAPAQPWRTGRVSRGRPIPWGDGPDLAVRITGACFETCDDGYAQLAVQVENHGTADAPAGSTLEVYTRYDAAEQLVATLTLPTVPAGQRLDGGVIDVPVERLGNAGFRVVVDPTGAVPECTETDNEATSADVGCL